MAKIKKTDDEIRVEEIIKYIVNNKIQHIVCEYSGSGDSGGMDAMLSFKTQDKKEKGVEVDAVIYELIEDLIYEATGADFNNDGSSGTMTLSIYNDMLVMSGSHSSFYQSSNDTDFDNHELGSVDRS